MSLRKAKLLLEQKKKNAQQIQQEAQESQQEEITQTQTKKTSNMFEAFGGDDSESQKEKEQVKQKKENAESKEGKKKKNKKKKKKKNEEKEQQKINDQEEDIDRMLEQAGWEVKKQDNERQITEEEWQRILKINESKFNYEKQLKRHFSGWQQEKGDDDPQLNKKQQKYQKHLKKMMKKSVLSPGVKDFFVIRQKFDIERDQDKIKFVPTKKYDHYQVQYDSIRNSNDINALIVFSQTHPEHVDSLYAIGEFLRLQGNYRDADNLIQRVLYVYQFAGSYDLQEFIKFDIVKKAIVYDLYSTSLFMSLFKMMDILGKKGCFKAALEYNKFLLKINIEDPTACLLSIDFNSISAKNYEYLINFIKMFSFYLGQKQSSLYFMPNFTYSIALAKFHLENQVKGKNQELIVQENNMETLLQFNEEHWMAALNAPNDHNFDYEDPKILMLRAIIIYPKLIKEIANKNQYSKQFINHPSFTGNQKKTFKQLLQHDFWQLIPDSYAYHFLKLQNESDSKGLDKILEVYVERSKILWKSNEVMLWVKGAMGFILNQIDSEKFIYQEFLQKMCIQEGGGISIPFNLRKYEHISKANFSDRVDQVDLANIQDNQQQNHHHQGNPINVQEGNPFSLFLQSLLPWVNLPQNQQHQFDPDMPDIQDDD